jgi:hypothetical protein
LKKKKKDSFIEFSKFTFYLLFQFVFIFGILSYQLLWYCSKKTVADCYVYGRMNELQNSGTLVYRYFVNNKKYEDYTTRNEISVAQQTIEIKYISFWPSMSRVNTFSGNWLGFLVGYGIYFSITSIIFLIPNDTMPRNSYFYFTKKKPWVNMIVK